MTQAPVRLPKGPAVILFGLPKAFVVECQVAGRDLGTQYVAVRDLQAACRALANGRGGIVIGATRLPEWDRSIVEEHAQAAGVKVEWLDPDEVRDLRSLVQAWTAKVRQPARPGPHRPGR